MIEIDGSIGGGQVLRTALGLSCLLKKPFYIKNIRVSRPNPGLQEQHLQCVLALAKISDAKVEGGYKNSKELYFEPKEVKPKFIDIKISTAGSVGLILQSLLIVGFKYPINLKILGGATYGKWAASLDFIDKVLGFWLRKLGMEIDIKVLKHGFYPQGGAEVEVKISPTQTKEKIFVEKIGDVKSINILCVASLNLKRRNVLERIVSTTQKELTKLTSNLNTKIEYQQTLCDGCGITIYAQTEYAVVGSSLCGEIKKTAEDVAKEVTQVFLEDVKKGSLDRYTSDQIIPYLALLGGKIKIADFTDHVKANIKVVEKFLNTQFKIDNTKNFLEV